MKPSSLIAAALALAFLAGCDTKSNPTAGSSDIIATKQADATKTDAPVAPTTTTPPATPEKPALDRGKLPKELESDAYHYFGLNLEKSLNVQITNSKTGVISTGSESVKLTDVKNGVATFDQTSTGGLADQVGTETVELRKDGVYLVHSDKIDVGKPQLALPVGLTAGKSWKVDSSMQAGDRHLRQQVTYTVVGEQSVTSGGKSITALFVSGKGTVTGLDGKKTQAMTDNQWYAKDMGLVKEIETVSQTGKGQKPVTFTMELQPTAPGGKK
jgi:hypothetical protein